MGVVDGVWAPKKGGKEVQGSGGVADIGDKPSLPGRAKEARLLEGEGSEQMIINDVSGVQGPQPVQPNRAAGVDKTQAAEKPVRADGAEISLEAMLLEKLRRVPEIRQDKVDALRQQIADGTYETPERLDAAVEKLMHRLRD